MAVEAAVVVGMASPVCRARYSVVAAAREAVEMVAEDMVGRMGQAGRALPILPRLPQRERWGGAGEVGGWREASQKSCRNVPTTGP